MNKTYTRINWQNAPSEATALNETNLNKMDSAINTIDDRVVAHDTRLDNAEYAIGQAGDIITVLQGDVSTLEGTVGTQGSAITALQNDKVDKSNGMGLSTLMNLEAQSRTNTGTIIGALLLDKYGQQATEIKLRNGIEVDSALSDSSTNPVQNKAIKMVLDEKVDKVAGKGLCDKSEVSVELPIGTPVGEEIATVVLKGQDGSDAIAYPIYNGIEVDSALSTTSENPVQNKVIKNALDGKVDKEIGKGLSSLSGLGITTSATTGDTIADILAIDQNGNEYHNYIKNGVEVDSALSSESENPVQNKAVTTELENKADVDGNYEDMAVGQLLSNIYEEDKAPYNFRTSGGTLEIGDREYDTLVGGTVAFNQLVNKADFPSSSSIFTNNGDGSVTADGTASGGHEAYVFKTFSANDFIDGHKYLIHSGFASVGSNTTFELMLTFIASKANVNVYTSDKVFSYSANNNTHALQFVVRDNATVSNLKCTPQIVDLTAMFGSTIADYIYSLEQATAGSGVAYFRSLFPKDYYAYNAGQLMSVKALSHKMVGFNQWDEEWELGVINSTTGNNSPSTTQIRSTNYISVFPTTTYYMNTSVVNAILRFYGANKEYLGSDASTVVNNSTFTTPENAHYVRFYLGAQYGTTYNNDICINLHWDGERDGEYEAYEEHIYPLDSDLELRGIPKLDANNNLYYDGDTYESDGTVTRKYGVVDLGTLNWVLIDDSNYPNRFRTSVESLGVKTNAVMECAIYVYKGVGGYGSAIEEDKSFSFNNPNIQIHNSAYSSASAFKTAMSGVYLVYELATPTTETADTFENPQLVDNWGTEEYIDSREVQIPVGHITKYPPDLKAKLESAPDSPASDGDYILRHNNGENSYVALTKELPAVPTTDGTYVLKATVSSGVATLSWVAEE